VRDLHFAMTIETPVSHYKYRRLQVHCLANSCAA
jgi:hypothetical protein